MSLSRQLAAVYSPGALPKSRLMWQDETCKVWAGLNEQGDFYFAGVDMNGPDGPGYRYEYDVTLKRRHIPRVIKALGGRRGDSVLALCVAQGKEIFRHGEYTWLESLGLRPTLHISR